MDRRSFNIKNIKYQSVKVAAAFSGAVFLLGGLAFMQPLSLGDNSYADSKNTAVSLRIGESIMVPEVSTDSINIELDPTAPNGEFKTASVTVGVSTNRTAGYTLTASVEGSETALMNAEYDDYEIAALGGKTAAAAFADLDDSDSMNKWGYATDNNGEGDGQTEAGYYYAMPGVDSPTTLKITDGPAATSETEVTFATKGKDLAAGKYENTVVFTAIGNLEPETLKDAAEKAGATTMQNFSSDICAEADTWQEGEDDLILTDVRDNEEYAVRKLKDGNCWMTSNLRLRGENLASGVSTTLNSTNTDLSSGTFVLPSSATWTSTSTTNKGLLYSGNSNAVISSSKTAAVSGTQAQARGTYYTWCTATANCDSATAAGGSAQPNSICPKGWKLPNSDGARTDANQFYKLYSSYSSSSQYADFMSAYNYYYNNVQYYFAGEWSLNGYVYGSSTFGLWWSSVPHSTGASHAWGMDISADSVAISGSSNRSNGRPIRCVLNTTSSS